MRKLSTTQYLFGYHLGAIDGRLVFIGTCSKFDLLSDAEGENLIRLLAFIAHSGGNRNLATHWRTVERAAFETERWMLTLSIKLESSNNRPKNVHPRFPKTHGRELLFHFFLSAHVERPDHRER